MIKTILKKVLPFILVSSITGCVNHFGGNINYDTKDSGKANTESFIFRGMGMGTTATTIPITKDLSLTATDMAGTTAADIVANNNFCPVSIIHQDNSGKKISRIGVVNQGDSVSAYGFDYYTSMMKKSEGVAYQKTYIKIYTNNDDNCVVFLSTTGTDTGMIGGPVLNKNGELVGMILNGTNTYYSEGNDDSSKSYFPAHDGVLKIKDGKYAPGEIISEKSKFVNFDYSNNHDKATKVNYSVFVPLQNILPWIQGIVKDHHERLKEIKPIQDSIYEDFNIPEPN